MRFVTFSARMRELAVQSASDTVNDNDRSSIDLEFEQLKAEYSKKTLIGFQQSPGCG